MEYYVTERDRELAREWIAPYKNALSLFAPGRNTIAVERLAERFAQVRQEERAAFREHVNLFCARSPLCSTEYYQHDWLDISARRP